MSKRPDGKRPFRSSSLRRLAIVGLLAVVLAQGILVAAPSSDLSTLGRFDGRVVQVRTLSGDVLVGRLVQASNTELDISIGGHSQRLGVGEIASVAIKGDSALNGGLKGAGMAVALSVISLPFQAETSCSTDCRRPGAGAYLEFIALGALTGAAVDFAHKGFSIVYRHK
jgi:hypothetical protein